MIAKAMHKADPGRQFDKDWSDLDEHMKSTYETMAGAVVAVAYPIPPDNGFFTPEEARALRGFMGGDEETETVRTLLRRMDAVAGGEGHLVDTYTKLAAFCHENEGIFTLAFSNNSLSWSSTLTWGREAPDSPMAAAQALGEGASPNDAIDQVVKEARL